VNFSKLPEIIPTHFGFAGKPDSFGSRNTVWILPAVSTILFLILNLISKNTDLLLLNIPNALRKNKKLSGIFVNILSTFVLLIFANLIYENMQIAMGKLQKLSHLPELLILMIFLTLIGFSIYARKLKKYNE
jgi:uncharacterized membrane protein